MIAEHRRPLMAFILVALVCALVVGNAVRTATFQRLVGGGLPLSVLVPIAPDVLLTINASGHNGLGGDVPYVGRAVIAVSNPAPPSVPAPVTTAVVTVSAASPTAAVQNTPAAAAPAAAAPAAAATSTRTAGRHHAAPRRAVTTSGTPTVAPARATPTLSSGGTKHGATAVDRRGPSPAKAVSHELKRAQHEAEKAAHRQALDQKHALKAETKHAGKPHHAKAHHQKQHHPKRHHEKRNHVKPHHEKRH